MAGAIKLRFLKVKRKVAQSCPTLCVFMDYTVHGTLQVRILEWVAYPFSSGSSWPKYRTGVSCIADRFFTNWVIREAPRFLRWGDYPGLSRWFNVIPRSLEKESRGRSDHRRRQCDSGGRDQSDAATSQGYQQPPKLGPAQNHSPLELPERTSSPSTLILTL